MARIDITIEDADARNIKVNVHLNPDFPQSTLLYTNAQMVAKEVLAALQAMANQINNKENRLVM